MKTETLNETERRYVVAELKALAQRYKYKASLHEHIEEVREFMNASDYFNGLAVVIGEKGRFEGVA